MDTNELIEALKRADPEGKMPVFVMANHDSSPQPATPCGVRVITWMPRGHFLAISSSDLMKGV